MESHVAACDACQAALAELRKLAGALAASPAVAVPEGLWTDIERRLGAATDEPPAARPRYAYRTMLTRPWALAAALALAVGLGMFGLSRSGSRVEAAAIDYSVLLDALPLNAHNAFQKFLVRYDAKPSTALEAKRYAGDLNFETPPELPGGFELQRVYVLRFGDHPGVAAAYDRDGELLAAIFHPPFGCRHFGARKDIPCVIGKHCGKQVQIGQWKLVHVTDPTTCHCVLSRLEESQLKPVLNKVAPLSPELDGGRPSP